MKNMRQQEGKGPDKSITDKLAAAHQVLTTLGMMDGTTLSHQAMLLRGEQPQPRPRVGAMAAEDNMDDDDHGPAPGPKSLSSVELAHTPGMFPNILIVITFETTH
jgi:hypothetical protein